METIEMKEKSKIVITVYKYIAKLEKEEKRKDLSDAYLTLIYAIGLENKAYDQDDFIYGINDHLLTQTMDNSMPFSEEEINYLTQIRAMNHSNNDKYYWDDLIVRKDSIEYSLKKCLDEKMYIELQNVIKTCSDINIKRKLIDRKYAFLASSKELEEKVLSKESLIPYNTSYLNPEEVCVATRIFYEDIIETVTRLLHSTDEDITEETYYDLIRVRSKLLFVSPITLGKMIETIRCYLNISYVKADTTGIDQQKNIRELIEQILLDGNNDIKQVEKK